MSRGQAHEFPLTYMNTKKRPMPSIAIIADDLTGACDTGIQLATAGYRANAIFNLAHLSTVLTDDAIAISTGTRDLDATAAAARVRDAALALKSLHVEYYYKKVDSLLRGNVFAEIGACMEVLGHDYCMLAPAYPDNGRRFSEGEVFVTDGDGESSRILANMSEVARFGFYVSHIPLADIVRGPVHLASSILQRIGDRPVVLLADAVENMHLQAIAEAIRLVPQRCLPAGSAGLAKHMMGYWPAPGTTTIAALKPSRPGGRVLIVAGSINPSTIAQVNRVRGVPGYVVYDMDETPRAILRDLKNLPATVVLTVAPTQGASPEQSKIFEHDLGQIVQEVFAPLNVGALILTGGETAQAVLDALGMHAISLEEEPLEGVAAGWSEGILVVTKSGGFGDRDALHALAVYATMKLSIQREVTSFVP